MKSIHDHRYAQIIELLIRARETALVTQTELANALDRPQSYIAKVENLDRRIDIIELVDWLSALEVAPDEFVCRLDWWRR